METLTNPRRPSGPTAAAPRWVMLKRDIPKYSGSSSAGADPKTTAASCTSSGLPFSISMSIAAPPDVSCFHYDVVAGAGSTPSRDADGEYSSNSIADHKDSKDLQLHIAAAHDDAVLIELRVPQHGFYSGVKFEYFLCEAGAGRTPSLSPLPGCYISNHFNRDKDAPNVPTRSDKARCLSLFKDTGILRRGEGEVLVAELELGYGALYNMAELCVLRPGDDDWVLKQLPIVQHDRDGELRRRMQIDATVPIGSRFMCWVDYLSGFILGDMAEENPELRYVPLPLLPDKTSHRSRDRPDMQFSRKLAAAGPSAVRFVNVAPRCCCGGPGKTSCERSSFAFNVTTWTLTLRTEEAMVWVKDSVLDCDELWQLPNYGRLPRVQLGYPIVSSDDPDIVCFTVCEGYYFIDDADETVWMVEINTRSKALVRVTCTDLKCFIESDFLPAKLNWL